jgi:hypothetical protein
VEESHVESKLREIGLIVRVNPDELHVSDPNAYDTIYARNPTHRDKWPAAANMSGSPLSGRFSLGTSQSPIPSSGPYILSNPQHLAQ